MYSVKDFQCDIGVEDYINGYVDVKKFIEFCRACPNYGKNWGCPPYEFDSLEYWRQFTELRIIARKIIIESEMDVEKRSKVLREEKNSMLEGLLQLENEHPESRALSAGNCVICREEGCTRASGEACRCPQRVRYSIESIGGDVGKTLSELLGIELEWGSAERLPSYYVLVCGLLTK